jgi:uncharacterized lipoprotein YmbA
MKNMTARKTALAFMLLLVGCTLLAPQKDDARFFVLIPMHGGAAQSPGSATSQSLVIGLGPITIPGYLNRPEVVTRMSDSELKVSDTDRWGERLDTNVAQVLAADLAAQLGTQQIVNYPWPFKTPIDYAVSVAFQRFERLADGHVIIEAKWTIRNGKNARIIQTDATSVSGPSGPDNASAAQALSRGLAQVSRDIAKAIVTQNPKSEPAIS